MDERTETVNIDVDERYPDYLLSGEQGWDCKVGSETLARWRRVIADYEQVQDEMEAAFKAANRRAGKVAT